MVRVLIVGAGVTGALCAHMLRRHLPTQLQCQIVVWEKSRGCGGRMAASRHPEHRDCIAELGAQYITQNATYAKEHKVFYDDLLQSSIIQPLEGVMEGFRGETAPNYIAPGGLSMIAKHFFSKSKAELCYNQRLESLRLTSEDISADWVVWEAATEKNQHDHFDAVIVTTPVPQTLELGGVLEQLTQDQVEDLKTVEYSSRFAVGLLYKPGSYDFNLPHIAKFVSDSDIIRFYSVDHAKRGTSPNETGASIIAHTSVTFGRENINEDKDVVGPQILDELKRLLPQLPEPDHVKFHKWRYSQVINATKKHYGCMTATEKPLLLFAGDGFTHSNFDGCIRSALECEKAIEKWMSRSRI